MKLVLANNHSLKFTDFYHQLQAQKPGLFDYGAYKDLLFYFGGSTGLAVLDTVSGKPLTDYDGVYINGYLSTYELAATVAICCQALGINFVNHEMKNGPSLSKLTMYAKLQAAGVPIPETIAGTKRALLKCKDAQIFPQILKRADADRGIDNFKVESAEQIAELLQVHPDDSLWILQEYLPNDGFYLVSYYGGQPKFSIFRSLEARPDGNELKAHMFKPKGGANAELIKAEDLPGTLEAVCSKAMQAMDRQIGSVDCIYHEAEDKTYVLEVNYNPQLVTIETFKDARTRAFLDGISDI